MSVRTFYWEVAGPVRKADEADLVEHSLSVTTQVRDAEQAKRQFRAFCSEMDWEVEGDLSTRLTTASEK